MPRGLPFLLPALVSCVAFNSTLASQAAKRPMTAVDLLNIPRVGDPQLSHDGRSVTFSLATTDWPGNRRVPQIWRVGSDGTGLRRLTNDEAGASSARWSPNGSTIAYLSGGSLFVLPSDGGTPRQISSRTSVSDIAWHPDGTAVYFLATDPPSDAERERQRVRGDIRVVDETSKRHLWKIAVAEGSETRVTQGNDYIFAYRISTRGDRIIISRRPSALSADSDRIELWNIGADGERAIQLTHNAIPETDAALSPDQSQVLFVSRANDRLEPYYNANLFLVPASGGRARAVFPDFPYEVLQAGWAADGSSIFMIVNMGVHVQLVHADLASHSYRTITTGEHALVPQSWTTAGSRHLFMIDEPARIGDIWTWTGGDAAPTRVTGIYDYLGRDFSLPRQARIEWKGADGTSIEGVLTYPIDYRAGVRYPLVVQMHGGPEDSDRFGWGQILFNYQPVWAAKGFAILRPNYRGSSGYGNAFYREPIGGYFKHSHLDVLAGVDHVVSLGVADPDRLALMGWSAGGHLVNKLITFTNRFKAAASGAGVSNWISLYGVSDTRSDRDLWFGGTLWQTHPPIETYWEHSPLKYVTKARTPTLFLIGENDTRVPASQAVELSRALKAQGVPAEVHIAPGEGHIWLRPGHQLYKMNVEIEWFEKYVRDRTHAPEHPPAENDANVLPRP